MIITTTAGVIIAQDILPNLQCNYIQGTETRHIYKLQCLVNNSQQREHDSMKTTYAILFPAFVCSHLQ